MFLRPTKRTVLFAALAAFLLKLALAASTIGTNDVITFERMVEGLNERGAAELYRTGTRITIDERDVGALVMNHPPFVLHVLRVWGALIDLTGLPLGFWMRLTCAAADLLVLWLVCRMCANWTALLLVAIAPASLLISGFHGNTDPIMIALAVAAVYLIEFRKRPGWAGVVFAAACSVKVWPLVLVPAFLLFIRPLRATALFVAAAFATGIVLNLPWVWTDGALIADRILGYGSIPGWWGLTYLIPVPLRPKVPTLMWACVLAAQMWMHERVRSLYAQCAVIAALFLFLTPGFGPQYLAWLVPWTAAAGWRLALPFHVTSGIYLLGIYTAWSQGWLYFADAHKYGIPLWVYRAGLLVWTSLPAIIAGAYYRHQDHRLHTARDSAQ